MKTTLLALICAVHLCADSVLWPDGIIDVPTAQGSGLATVAYDGEVAYFWLSGDVQGAQGYLTAGPVVAGLLAFNTRAVGPDYIRFHGTAPLEPAADYRLITAMPKVVPGAIAPEPVFASAPFSLEGGRLTTASAIPEPGVAALLLLGLFIVLHSIRYRP